MNPQTNPYPQQPQQGWPSNNINQQMGSMQISGPPKPGMPPMPQQYQQNAAFNNNQVPPQSMMPGGGPSPNNYPINNNNNNNNNQFPPSNGMQNGAGQMTMPPMSMANKVPVGQFSPAGNAPILAPPSSMMPPAGFPSMSMPPASSQNLQQSQQIPQQGQRPPIPGEPSAQQNGHRNGPEMPPTSVTPQQSHGMQQPAPFNSHSTPQQQQYQQQDPALTQGRPPMALQQFPAQPPLSNTSQMPPLPGQAPQISGQPQPGQQFPGMPPMQQNSAPGMPPMPGQPGSALHQVPGMPPMPGQPGSAPNQVPGMPPMPGQPGSAPHQVPGMPPMPGQQRFQGQPPMAGGQPPQLQQQMPGQFPSQPGMPPPGPMQNRQNFNQPPGVYSQPQQPGQFPPQQPGQFPPQQPGQFPQQPGQFPQPSPFPQQPGMGAPQYASSPMAAAPQRRLDPDQMPNPIQVMAENQRTAGGPFSTLQVGQIPPLVTTDFITQDQGNSGPRYVRSTMYNVPSTTDMMKQSAVPFALVVSPMARNFEGEMAPPIVDFGEIGPIRCVRCKAYMSPHMQFTDAGRRFQCLLCKATTEVPAEYFQHLDHTGQRVDKYERPELVLGTYEFVATKDYCRNNVPPKPPAMVFVIDVSYNNVKSGLVHLMCAQMKNIIRNLPIDQGQTRSKMKVGFITYNNSVHFYNIKSTLAQPQMMVVGDVHEMFMPLLDGFLADPEESEAVIDLLMEQIPKMYGDTRETETILLPAIQAGLEAIKASECAGKLLVFQSSLPVADAPGQLKNRDDRKVLGTEKEKTVLTPQSTAYNNLGQECVNSGCSVDLFIFNNSYIDLATIGQVSRLTGGEIFKYTYFQADIDGQRLVADIIKNISRPIAFDTVMRVRTSTGTRPTDFYGHFFMSNTTDMEIASIDCDKSVAIEIKHDDKLPPDENVYIQIALLYTSTGGQRRLRVMNLALKTCTQLADLFRSCDLDTTILFFAKQGVTKLLEHTPKVFKDNLVNRAAQILACYRKHCASPTSAGQLILPECLKLLPLYVSCLLKNDAFSGGSDLTIDDRSYSMYFVSIMDLPTSVTFFYPRLIPIHNIDPEGDEEPVPIRCTIDKMTDDGAYILDNGIYMFIYLGMGLSPEFTQAVFGVSNTQQVDTERVGLPSFDNAWSKRIHGIVNGIQKERTRCMRIALVRQRDKLESVLRHFLIEDRGSNDRGNYNDYNDDNNSEYYRKRERATRDDDRYYNSNGSSSRRDRDRRHSRSRSRDGYNDEDSWSSSNRDKNYDRRNRDNNRDRDRRNYDRRDYRKHGTSNYDSDESDGGNSYSSEPNNKVIVRGLAQHITEADIQCDLIQCGLKALSIRLIRKKRTEPSLDGSFSRESRGFAFVAFSTVDEARKWLDIKQGVLILQDQYRALLQYSFSKESDGQYDKLPTDWYCNCGVFNFKRRDNCFKCSASREESEKGGEGSDEISNILTKKIMFRNLDALTNEEKVLTVLQENIPEQVSKVSKILICRDPLTQISRGICYLNFDNLVDSMNTFQALEKLETLQIENRDVTFSYCIDSDNRNIGRPAVNNSRRENTNNPQNLMNDQQQQQQQFSGANYQYTLADIPKLAEQAANMYAQNPTEKESYVQYYTDFYTKQISQGLNTSLPSYSQYEAHSGASIAQSAIERKHKMKAAEPAPPGAMFPAQQVDTPKGNDGKKYPTPDTSLFTYDESSGYYYDASTNLFYDATSQYFYNSEISQFMYWDVQKSTYIAAPSTNDENGATSQQNQPPPPPAEQNKKPKEQPQDKVKVAKKIVKDMEKWAKQLNQKKDYTPISVQQQARSDDSQSPPAPSFSSYEPGKAADVGFTILEKKDRTSLSLLSGASIAASKQLVPVNKQLPVPYHSDSEEEDQAANASLAAGNALSEKDYVDFDKLTCMLCKRAFPSAEVLTKHLKMSNLHKENLQKYKMTQGILDIGGAGSAAVLNYRDRAKERRKKYGEADPVPVNRSKERFQREMEKQASIAQTYQSSTLASQPISEGNIGNKLLQKMGWKAGSGLGKSNQGRTEIIETEQRVSNAGLGSKSASFGAGPGDDYKTYIKKMMKKRYEEVE